MPFKLQRQCPLYTLDSGVCGCPEFWSSPKPSVHHQQPQSHPKPQQQPPPTSDPTPHKPPQETCFFWYHGTCKTQNCTRAHEVRFTWPIPPPPGFVHFQPCTLPLCPLREDLLGLMSGREEKKGWSQEVIHGKMRGFMGKTIGGQLDGAAMSFFSRIEDEDGDSERSDTSGEGEEMEYESVTSEFESDLGTIEEAAQIENEEVAVDEDFLDDSCRISEYNNADFIDLPDSSSSESLDHTAEQPLSLSHIGTLGKRKRPNGSNNCDATSSRKKSRYLSSSTAHPSNSPVSPLRSSTFVESRGDDVQPPLNAPTGPHAFGKAQPPICFYWYHKGYCYTKKLRNGRRKCCMYAHTLDISNPQVSLPPRITDHDPDCPLPFCPVRMQDNSFTMDVKAEPDAEVEQEPLTPSRSFTFTERYSSSPRADLADDLRNSVGHRYATEGKYQGLPELTGEIRQRYKEQKGNIEQWQADNGIKPHPALEKVLEARREARSAEKEANKQRKMEVRQASTAGRSPEVVPKAEGMQQRTRPRVLVDYELPEGDDRLDWDTDLVRRTFGEIE